ncbi:MAG TPA: hypothetical protein PLO37_02140 [Candidatus Hydrogenedentes bacterium]|nr:hypothetical protein [Candidatus Hydrogenedentota bacterium]HPG65618.1 hypothetical protein [Candidatus Hydrogenedentota bacterium]
MLGRALKMAFWATYDHVGKLMVANLIASLAVFALLGAAWALTLAGHPVAIAAGVALAVLVLGVIAPAFAAGLAHMAKVIVDTREGAIADFFAGVRFYGRRAAYLGMAFLVAAICLVTSGWFYMNALRDKAPWLGFGLSALALWCLCFLSLTYVMAIPALVQKKATARETTKLAAVLVLDNPLFILGLALQLMAWAALSVVLMPLVLFLSWAVATMLLVTAYEQLARKYTLIEVERGGVPASREGQLFEGATPGIRVISRDGSWVIDEENDDYLNRGFRDFLFPWKG